MNNAPVVIFHKDHPLSPYGVNAGAETATIALAHALHNLGRKVFLAAQLPADFLPRADGITYIDLTAGYNVESAFELLASRYHLEHYHLIVASRAQALLASRGRSEVLSRIFISHEPSATALGAEPAEIAQIADHVVSVSAAQQQLIISAGCPREKLIIVPNGANQELFIPGDPERRDYQRLVFVGALVIDKGVHLLLEAFARLRMTRQLKLDIYGSAKLWGRDDYFNIELAKTIPGVTFHGAVGQEVVAEAFRTAGLLVLPSIFFDSFPLTVVEAQVSGLPVLGSRNGGMPEIVRDGITGRLLDQVSVESLIEAIQELTESSDKLKAMSRNAVEQLRPLFNWDKTARDLLCLMDMVRPTSDRNAISIGEHKDFGSIMAANNLPGKVGVLTTFNQRCGLATYARYLTDRLSPDDVVVLAEDVPAEEIIGVDEPNVVRCWQRLSTQFGALARAIERHEIRVLHLNCHYRFFDGPIFASFLNNLRQRGISVISHIHNPYTVDPALQCLVAASDRVIVHTIENKLEVAANGGSTEQICVLEHGVELLPQADRRALRRELGIPEDQIAAVTFGFVQAHKGIDEAIRALHRLKDRHSQLHLYIVGGPHQEDPSSREYYHLLIKLVQDLRLSERVHFSDSFVPEEKVDAYLQSADIVLMNYRSMYYEASGAAARALGAGAAVIASIAPAFARLGDAVFHATSGYPLELAMDVLITNPQLASLLRANARAWAERYSWENTAKQLAALWREVGGVEARVKAKEWRVRTAAPIAKDPAPGKAQAELSVLMQNRPNAKTQPGGDTVVMERVAQGLRELGVHVDIVLDGSADPANYDLVHLHNFATPEITERQARLCVERNVPYVVTTMYEDLPTFFNQMVAQFEGYSAYISQGQRPAVWQAVKDAAKHAQPAPRWENGWTAEHAAALIGSGESECKVLRRDYPRATLVRPYELGCEVARQADPELFIKEYGVRDFILCVGRLETRKNQLSLLKALEETELPVVFATGGFTYQQDYEDLCRRFKRSGQTVFLGRLAPEMLAGAFAAAKMHALPSWYELPGIVSLEAARLGKNIVVTDRGTARDYFGDGAYYCEPDDIESIYNAVMAAYYAPVRRGLVERVAGLSWDNAAKQVLSIYHAALGVRPAATVADNCAQYELPEWKDPAKRTEDSVVETIKAASDEALQATASVAAIPKAFNTAEAEERARAHASERVDAANVLAKSGQFDEAEAAYEQVLNEVPEYWRALQGLGVLALRREAYAEAERLFSRAVGAKPDHARLIAGLGASRFGLGQREEGYRLFLEAARKAPDDLSVVLHVMNAAYQLNELGSLEGVLRSYLAGNVGDRQMAYCLAGCLFKQGKLSDARAEADKLLLAEPTNAQARELLQYIDKAEAEKPQVTLQPEPEEVEPLKVERIAEPKPEADMLQVVLDGEIAARQGRLESAEEKFKEAEADPQTRSRALTGRGVVAAEREDWNQARNLFEEAIACGSDNDTAIAGLAICVMKQGDAQAAFNLFQRALQVNPDNSRAVLGTIQLGYPLGRLDDIERAIKGYLDMHPGDLDMIYSYAGCLYAKGDSASAFEELEKIRIFKPDHPLALELREKIAHGEAPTVPLHA